MENMYTDVRVERVKNTNFSIEPSASTIKLYSQLFLFCFGFYFSLFVSVFLALGDCVFFVLND